MIFIALILLGLVLVVGVGLFFALRLVAMPRQRAWERARRQAIARRHLAGVNAFDVERPQSFLHELGELAGERRFLHLVLAHEEIQRIGRGGGDLLADLGRGADQNASRMALTMVRANSEVTRSSALARKAV